MISGRYQVQPRLPFTPGLEAAGVVTEVGAEVRGFRPGDPVLALSSAGGYAEELVDDEGRFMALPKDMDFVTAAGFSVTYGTAHLGLLRRARLQAGETLVVHGAGGGAGSAAVEVGKALGATVIATAGSAEKLDLARARGADHVINSRTEDLRGRILELTGGRGADVIYDPVGGSVFKDSLRALAFEGRIVLIGFASGELPQIPANHLLVKNAEVIGLYWGGYKPRHMAALQQSLTDVIGWWRDGRLQFGTATTWPLAEAGAALSAMADRKALGKLVLTVSAPSQRVR
ncbi:NADPH:quinone oxidoreductase family protein [Alphaproteobacteria bacterium LMG 31809]|uniref:NADPH:quinone oxidoreductase family protein n=2 Tax=Govanella unica TaxID=2975056 RepID=A0A9X3TW85_9PROT|nr:NADPH:quinone oxidoreductase family protein [Govania unica]